MSNHALSPLKNTTERKKIFKQLLGKKNARSSKLTTSKPNTQKKRAKKQSNCVHDDVSAKGEPSMENQKYMHTQSANLELPVQAAGINDQLLNVLNLTLETLQDVKKELQDLKQEPSEGK